MSRIHMDRAVAMGGLLASLAMVAAIALGAS